MWFFFFFYHNVTKKYHFRFDRPKWACYTNPPQISFLASKKTSYNNGLQNNWQYEKCYKYSTSFLKKYPCFMIFNFGHKFNVAAWIWFKLHYTYVLALLGFIFNIPLLFHYSHHSFEGDTEPKHMMRIFVLLSLHIYKSLGFFAHSSTSMKILISVLSCNYWFI